MSTFPRLPAEARATTVAALAYLLMALLWAAPSSLHPWDTLPDLGDPLHLSYVMAWDAHQLVHRPWALYDSNSFFPYARSLAFGDHLLPEALMVAPINWLTGNAVLASNVGVVLALWLSALSMFALVRRVTGSGGAAFLAGLLYAFNSFTRHELLRVHVLNVEWWPLALLFLDRFVREGRRRDAQLFAFMLTLQGLSGAYYLICTALLAPLWLAASYAALRRRPTRHEVGTLLAALAIAAAPAALILWPYLGHLKAMGFEKGLVEGADVLCSVDPAPESWLFGGFQVFSGCFGLPHFLGFVGAGLMVAGAVLVLGRRQGATEPRAASGSLALLTALVGLALSWGPLVRFGGRVVGPGPFRLLYEWVPLVRGMDGSKRIGVLVILGGAILAGLALARLLEGLSARAQPVALAVLAVLLPLEHWTAPGAGAAVPTGERLPAVYRWLAGESAEPLVELPLYPDVAKRYWAAYLYFSTYHWRPIPIGRTSFYPPAHDFLAFSLRDFPDDTSLLLLERLGIRTIVVHPRVWADAERARRLTALDADPRLRRVRVFEETMPDRFADLGLGQERVYALVGIGPRGPAPCMPADELPRDAWDLRSLRRGVTVPTGEHAAAPRRRPRNFGRWIREREWRTPWIAEWARDDDRRTVWTTADAQRQGDGIEVTLPHEETIAAATLDLSYPYDEFPRSLVLAGEGGVDDRRKLPWADGPEERWATLDDLLHRPREARLVVRLRPQPLTVLGVKIGPIEEDSAFPRWSVPELRLFRECR